MSSDLPRPDKTYDVLIVGAGPAGLAAGIYLGKAHVKTLILEADKPGGKLNGNHIVQNYPGFNTIKGSELSERIVSHAKESGLELLSPARATGFDLVADPKVIRTRDREFFCRRVILAMGVQRRRLDVKGARELLGRGVAYCPVCDGALFKGLDVIVFGNDNDAVEDSLYLQPIARMVYLVSETNSPKFDQDRLQLAANRSNLKFMKGFELKEILGDKRVEKARLRSPDGEMVEIQTSGVFFSGEKAPVLTALESSGIEVDAGGCVPTNEKFETNLPGVYAIGDMTCEKKYQVS
ncbi:MAG: FAD-dependent oxidoreductase, partial [archaeon]